MPSGGAFRTGAKAATVRQAVEHMDRYPADGIKVLRDGTLAAWFDEEGAHHLAALARDVTRGMKSDGPVVLETFLIGTGLVERPRLVIDPAGLHLGYVVQGQTASGRVCLDKARGSRGFIFGSVTACGPWLRVEPREFAGTPAELVVTADTAKLAIAATPYTADVEIACSAGEEPIRLPVTVSVVAQPPGLIRVGVRPLTGLLIGAGIGAVIGLLWRATGLVGDGEKVLWIAVLAAVLGTGGRGRAVCASRPAGRRATPCPAGCSRPLPGARASPSWPWSSCRRGAWAWAAASSSKD